MSAKELANFSRDLEMAPLLIIRKFYEDAYARCQLTQWALPSPGDMQELVAAWKVLRKRARQQSTRRDGGILSRTT